MSPGTRMKKECEARLRALLSGEEEVLAAGTAEKLRSLGPRIGSGTGWTFVVLTTHRLLFAAWGGKQEPHEEIHLDEISRWASGDQYNCHAVVLDHPPVETIFRFSRKDTELAKALRSALEGKGVLHEPLRFDERSRAERTRGSHVLLTSEPDASD